MTPLRLAAIEASGATSRRGFLSRSMQITAGLLASDGAQCPGLEPPLGREDLPIHYQSATQLAEGIRRGAFRSTEVVQAFLNRITAVEPKIQAVLFRNDHDAVKRAKQADKARSKGNIWGPLHGVPISVKDNLNTSGIPTTCGVPVWRGNIPTTDATVVRKLKDAGAIILAKTNLPFCGEAYESESSFQRTNNPYDIERTPGGSSGGEGALIAAGGSPAGIGADTGGSIRVPSHFCGIAGLRPAHGRVSMAGFLPEYDSPGPVWYTSAGPMARCVADLALLFRVLAGPDRQDPFTFTMPLRDYRRVRPGRLSVGWWTGDANIQPSAETQAAVVRAADVLAQAGARVQRIEAPYDLKRADDILVAVFAESIISGTPTRLKELGAETDKLMLDLVEMISESLDKIPASQLAILQNELKTLRRRIHASMVGFDAVLCPVTRNPAPPHGTTWRADANQEFCYCQLTGLVWTRPTGVVRCGTSPEGLPIGVQVVGAPYREDIVLGVLSLLEQEIGGWKPPQI